jgi:hypothetical protein
MQIVVRRCAKCGSDDLRHHWDSMAHAAADGALRMAWVCPNCAWPETDVVETDISEERLAAFHTVVHSGGGTRH